MRKSIAAIFAALFVMVGLAFTGTAAASPSSDVGILAANGVVETDAGLNQQAPRNYTNAIVATSVPQIVLVTNPANNDPVIYFVKVGAVFVQTAVVPPDTTLAIPPSDWAASP